MPFVEPKPILGGRAVFAYVDDVSIALSNVHAWSDADVDRYLRDMTDLAGKVTAKGTVLQFFGDVFGAHHRRYVVDWLKREGLTDDSRACVLTDSAILRGATTAYAWLTHSESAAFAPRDLDEACAWVTRGFRAKPEAVASAYRRCRELLDPKRELGAAAR